MKTRFEKSSSLIALLDELTLLTQDVVYTSIQRLLNVMDGRWMLNQRCVLTGYPVFTINGVLINKDETSLVISASLAPGSGDY